MQESTKICPTCQIKKPVDEFGKNRRRKDGLSFYCKPCGRYRHRAYRDANPEYAEKNRQRLRVLYADQDRYLDYLYRSKFGISIERYNSMLQSQSGGCAICGHTPDENSPRLSVDHDHACCPGKRACGKCVRGLLCSDCNFGLGKFRDQVEYLTKAIAYLTT